MNTYIVISRDDEYINENEYNTFLAWKDEWSVVGLRLFKSCILEGWAQPMVLSSRRLFQPINGFLKYKPSLVLPSFHILVGDSCTLQSSSLHYMNTLLTPSSKDPKIGWFLLCVAWWLVQIYSSSPLQMFDWTPLPPALPYNALSLHYSCTWWQTPNWISQSSCT